MNGKVKSGKESASGPSAAPDAAGRRLAPSLRTRASKKLSISLELTGLVLGSLLMAALFFLAVNRFSAWYIAQHYESGDYIQSRNREMAEELQEYISENSLSSTDREALNRWVKKKSVISMYIFRDGYLIYDSGDPDSEEEWLTSEGEFGSWETLEPILFSDGYAYLVLYGNYAYQMNTIAMLAELFLAFLLFLGGISLGIRKTIRYIRQLKQEIQILESGSLDYPITVKGRDELSELAEGLDAMRISLKAQMEEETRVTLSHQKIITGMSHDLRTPLTSILLYAEIIQKEGAQDAEKTLNYVQKIDRKARQMKNLTERIFAYSMAGTGGKAEDGSAAEPGGKAETGSAAEPGRKAEAGSFAGTGGKAEAGSAAEPGGKAGSAAAAEADGGEERKAEAAYAGTDRPGSGADFRIPSGTDETGAAGGRPQPFKAVFFDVLSEIGTCLEQSGFQTEWEITWSAAQIFADGDYVGRIADNLMSNLLKYAEPSGVVRIRTEEKEAFVCLIFENAVRQLKEKPDSTGIGVPNIRRMMESMGGRCEITQTENAYRTELYFRKS